ncbi:ribosome maturation factor RimM [bacterium BMS3Bbin14]|nr:ribosome maturation factor RimM [bacterium BMS3Abin13]GBE53143.1 ribosome maturation factor RimM [bacterium BMS3Bbin14]HDK43360.1 16S rRNA processing protein RimM [Desulfobacteraceae bacterium]HDL98349.1 16S rRNA processing protein RimM [Desulfobacteraceae bacterium]HDO31237.1 16S rRNA processing protein RimM [Desulfobacteraceae bacterium]
MTAAGKDAGEYVLIGKVAKPHGIKGEIKVYPYSGQQDNFLGYKKIFLAAGEDGVRIPYTVESSRVQGKLALLRLSGVSTRNDAEGLIGSAVWLRRRDLPGLKKGEYYWSDLVGKRAVTDEGRELGLVKSVMTTAAHDILTVTDHGHEYLIPLAGGFLVRLDENEVVLNLPPGLLEINLNP